MGRSFIFCTGMGANNRLVGNMPAVAYLGHYTLNDDKTLDAAHWDIHSFASNKQLMRTGLVGPNGPVMAPSPTATKNNPNFKMSWSGLDAHEDFTVKIGALQYHWQKQSVIDPGDPERYECQGFLPGQWSQGFGYFTDDTASAPITYDDLAVSYSGEQYQSAGGVWTIPQGSRRGAGWTVNFYDHQQGRDYYYFPAFPAGDGTGLDDLGMFGLNCLHHSNLLVVVYGGHDYNKDGIISPLDGGHSWYGWLIRRAGKLDRLLYVENSYQITGAVDPFHGWPVDGNIICIAYLRGIYPQPDGMPMAVIEGGEPGR